VLSDKKIKTVRVMQFLNRKHDIKYFIDYRNSHASHVMIYYPLNTHIEHEKRMYILIIKYEDGIFFKFMSGILLYLTSLS